jgi:hypothetical protein
MKPVWLAASLAVGFIFLWAPASVGDTLLPESVSDVLKKGAKEASIDAEFGMQWRHESYEEKDAAGDDKSRAGWAYAELGLLSGSMVNFQLGLGAIGVHELWAKDRADNEVPGDNIFKDDVFEFKSFWTEAYLKYSVPKTKTHFILGRADDGLFGEPRSGDGDYYTGFGVTVKDIPQVKIRAHVVTEWVNNASTSWDYDGIQEDWVQLSDEGKDAAYTLIVDAEAIEDLLDLQGYVQHHGDVGTSYGLTLEAEYDLNDMSAIGLEGTYARFSEDTPDTISADDSNMSQYIINPYVKYSKNKWKGSFGVGYYHISDHIPPFNTLAEGGDDFEDIFIWDEFDPMEEDLAKYGEQQNNKTYFIHAGLGYGPVYLKAIYGWVDDAIIEDGLTYEGEATELDVYLNVNITENVELELVYCDVDDDFKVDGDRSFSHFSGLLAYKF